MKQKIRSILDHIIQEPGAAGIRSYKENDDGSFFVETVLSASNHWTTLSYEPTGDNTMFRIQIKHVFGYLDVRIPPGEAAAQMLQMLALNTGSFSNTTAFVGIEQDKNTGKIFATLNSFHHFLTKWSDAEIAEALYLHFFDLVMGIDIPPIHPSLTMVKKFVRNQ